ncbi:MAG: alternative ribosome rescue aminoacyl-tRNA hydrolase ArfB [Rhizobiaceae bacterium]|nr:alternative ribosome rescue aminoacyl-tRNA hydrolase ArfB [Rhizobiaceae bacterium]
MANIRITGSISIESDELTEKFVRASGPGGQNVNKVSTAVQLRFNVRESSNLPYRVKQKILDSGDTRLTKEGELVIIAESKRTQEANRRDALARLVELIRDAAYVPKTRIATRPSKGAVKRRLESKAKRSQVKKNRSGKINLD